MTNQNESKDYLVIYAELLAFAVGLTILTSIHYLTEMVMLTNPGLVFDDSYIHLQYAKSIFEGHPWQYNIGEPSTGSTSPLWAIVLVPSFLLGNYSAIVWGVLYTAVLFYTLCTFLVGYIGYTYTDSKILSILTMSAFIFVPRNSMLMLSGMETPIFMFCILLSIALLDKTDPKYDPLIGIAAGLVYLARPEGVLVAAILVPARFVILLKKRKINRNRIIPIILMFAWMALIAGLWVAYCLNSTGHPLPATFYSKVGSFGPDAITVWNNHWGRWLVEYPYLPIGFIAGFFLVLVGKPYQWLLVISLTILYANTLPYLSLINNSRYLVPVFDLLIICAVLSISMISMKLFTHQNKVKPEEIKEYANKTYRIIVVLLLVFVIFTAAYPKYLEQGDYFAREVIDTNCRQIIIGKWIKENTPEDAVIAIHDAGAIKLFSDRRIIDMAGLVTPDITFGNFTRKEKLSYLRSQGCEYFAYFNRIFNTWTSYLKGAYTVVFSLHCSYAVLQGNANMSVYWINWSLTSY